jgi:hypothetical protein
MGDLPHPPEQTSTDHSGISATMWTDNHNNINHPATLTASNLQKLDSLRMMKEDPLSMDSSLLPPNKRMKIEQEI